MHDRVGAGDERLGDVAGVLQTAVGDHRDAGLARREDASYTAVT